jgi:hypothetical protein
MDDHIVANRASWDARTPVHVASQSTAALGPRPGQTYARRVVKRAERKT